MKNSEARALHEEGVRKTQMNDLAGALQCHEQALDALIGTDGEVLCRAAMGILRVRLGQIDSGFEHLHKALEVALETDDRRGQMTVLGDLGSANQLIQNLATAEESYERGLAIAQLLNSRANIGKFMANLGLVQISTGKIRAGRSRLLDALSIHEEMNDAQGIGMCHGGLGMACLGEGNPASAVQHFEQAMRVAKSIGNQAMYENAANGLAAARGAMGV